MNNLHLWKTAVYQDAGMPTVGVLILLLCTAHEGLQTYTNRTINSDF